MKATRRNLGAVVSLLTCLWAGVVVAEEITAAQLNQLDNEVQEAKSEILDISMAMTRLEEKLIYPEASRLTVFLVQEPGMGGELVALKLRIDGKEAADHIYTSGEVKALRHGGAQRIYMGNIKPGQHAIEVTVASVSENNDHWQTASYRLFKRSGMKTVEITIAGLNSGDFAISFRD